MINYGFILTKEKNFVKVRRTLSSIPKKDYVLLKILYCGICGGDYSCYIGRRNEYPKSLGHEFVGEIIAIGENVLDLNIGDIVISDLNFRCETCDFCLTNRSHLCVHNNDEHFSNRAFFQYVSINKTYLVKLNKPEYLYRVTLVEPLSCVIHAFSKITCFSNILINGCGSIGMLAAFYAKQVLKIKNVYVNDINKDRENNLCKYFNTIAFDTKKHNDIECAFECSNSITGISKILKHLNAGTTICVMSHLYGENTSFIYEYICKKEFNALFPLRNGNKANLNIAYTIICNYWKTDYDNMLGIYNYENINDIFERKLEIPYNKQILKMDL